MSPSPKETPVAAIAPTGCSGSHFGTIWYHFVAGQLRIGSLSKPHKRLLLPNLQYGNNIHLQCKSVKPPQSEKHNTCLLTVILLHCWNRKTGPASQTHTPCHTGTYLCSTPTWMQMPQDRPTQLAPCTSPNFHKRWEQQEKNAAESSDAGSGINSCAPVLI